MKKERVADPTREIWDREDVAHYMGISRPTVDALVAREGIPSIRSGRLVRFRRLAIMEFVEKGAGSGSRS